MLSHGEYEADDLIGSALHAARPDGFRGVIVSADKDLSQLLGEHDEQWDFARGQRWGMAGVKARHGVEARQIADYLALTGDAVDNIPGVSGIGAKSAAVLLAHFGDLDTLLARVDEVAFLRLRGAATMAARRAVRQIDGVRSVAWIDRENLFVIVSHNAARTDATIDAACFAMEPLGDTLGVVVHLQSGEAVDADDLRILSRNCQLPPGERAFLQRDRPVDVIPDAVQSQHRADNPRDTLEKREWERRNRESMKLLEASTPEM